MATIWASVAALAAVGAVFFGWRQTQHSKKQLKLARKVWEDSVQPYVFANVGMSHSDRQLLVVSVQNTGSTAAHNIEVRCNPPIVNLVNGDEVSSWQLPTLGPGAYFEKVVSTGINFYENKDTPRRVRFTVMGEGPFGDLDIKPYDVDIEALGEMLGAQAWTQTTANSLKKIADAAEVIKHKL